MELIEVTSVDETDPTWGLAMQMASKSPMKFKLGAILIKRGNIIGFGYNSRKTHPYYGSKRDYKTLHAEGASIYAAKKLGNCTQGSTMIIYRKGARMSKPCADCMKLIEKAGIKKVVFTNYEGRFISEA